MVKCSVTVINSKGFHLRPASKLLQLATESQAERIELRHPQSGRQADCRNMMALMMMSSPQGTVFELEVDADDAQQTADAIAALFARGFDDES